MGRHMQYHKNYSCYVCTVDFVGQGRLTIILTISISVIRSARKMIFFYFQVFWVDKFNEIKISFVTCTADFVGQGRLTTILTISISAIRGC